MAALNAMSSNTAMVAGDLIQIEVMDQVVTGVVACRTEHNIEIEIISPYYRLKAGCQIGPTETCVAGDYLVRDVDTTVPWLLRDCYNLGAFLSANLPRLRAAWQQHLEALTTMATPALYDRQDFLDWRRGMRGLLRAGLTTQAHYQANLRKVREANVAFDASFWMGKTGFFQVNFPISMAHMDLDQVIPVLEGSSSLRPER